MHSHICMPPVATHISNSHAYGVFISAIRRRFPVSPHRLLRSWLSYMRTFMSEHMHTHTRIYAYRFACILQLCCDSNDASIAVDAINRCGFQHKVHFTLINSEGVFVIWEENLIYLIRARNVWLFKWRRVKENCIFLGKE